MLSARHTSPRPPHMHRVGDAFAYVWIFLNDNDSSVRDMTGYTLNGYTVFGSGGSTVLHVDEGPYLVFSRLSGLLTLALPQDGPGLHLLTPTERGFSRSFELDLTTPGGLRFTYDAGAHVTLRPGSPLPRVPSSAATVRVSEGGELAQVRIVEVSVELIGASPGSVATSVDEFEVVAPGESTFALTSAPILSTQVFLNGLLLRTDGFSLSGSTLELTSDQTEPGDTVAVYYT